MDYYETMTNTENIVPITVSVDTYQLDQVIAQLGQLDGVTMEVGAVDPIEHDSDLNRCYQESSRLAQFISNRADATDAKTVAQVEDARIKLEQWSDRAHFLEELYTGWTRYTIHPEGHLHEGWGRKCSSLRMDTELHLAPEVSGMSPEEAIAVWGEVICSKCYPEAPTEWTNGPSWAKRANRLRIAMERLPEVKAANKCREKLNRKQRNLDSCNREVVDFLVLMYEGPWARLSQDASHWAEWVEKRRPGMIKAAADAPKYAKSVKAYEAKLVPLAKAETAALLGLFTYLNELAAS